MIAIIDYQLGNMFSVKNACQSLGLEAVITSDRKVLLAAEAAILPGVGAFGDAMNNLLRLDLVEPIKDFLRMNRPFMGVCLGLQLLFDESEEFGSNGGLGIIPGIVKRFTFEDPRHKVPQVGWNTIEPPPGGAFRKWPETPLGDTKVGQRMYFVHSFYVVPTLKDHVLSTTNYCGTGYCSSVIHGNIFATQFHPEKSAGEGIKIYGNWARTISRARP